nr:retrovirus-related Pol polyprotein from transposon TNT 1-94 [Tanacetum cinerariifolium]
MFLKWGRFITAVKLNRGLRDTNYDQLHAYLKQHETMFMANLSSTDPVYDEAGPSYDSNILSEVHDHDHYQDGVCEHHEVHEMHDGVQPNYVVDSYTSYTSDSNMIPYDQYVRENAVKVVQSDVSIVPNDAYMMILNDMHELPAQHVYVTTQTKVGDKLLTAELATYKEQVELYERQARFKLTEREQKIVEQLRIVITDRNIKELHSVKMIDFASWQQWIRLYCRGKENGVNILKLIDEGPFQIGTLKETLTEGTEGALHLGPERPRVYFDLTSKEKDRFITAVKLNRGLRDTNYDQLHAYLKHHEDLALNVDVVFQADDYDAFDSDVDEAPTA